MIGSDENIAGIGRFLTTTRGIGGKLKLSPEDFVVEELALPPTPRAGEYVIARIRAENWETNELIDAFARTLHIGRHCISFAGMKDKRAVKTQLFSFRTSAEHLQKLDLPDVEILESYTANRAIKIGNLCGNKFAVTIRNIELPGAVLRQRIEAICSTLESHRGFPNFFGVQRFGAMRPITHLVGKHIIKRDFERAVLTYLGKPLKVEPQASYEAREYIERTRDFEGALQIYPSKLRYERMLLRHLAKRPDDFPGALKRLPSNLLLMFVHSYQSYLFNKLLTLRLQRGLPLDRPVAGDMILPIDKHGLPDHRKWIAVTAANLAKLSRQTQTHKAYVGGLVFGYETAFAAHEPGELEHEVIDAEGISRDEFVIPQMPRLSSKGIRRELLAPIKDLAYELGENNVTFRFTLLKGQYATSLLREFMKGKMMDY